MKNPTLPVELIREILLRLPVKSVLRFRCVCKTWLSLVSDSQFGISHYDLAASPSHRIFLRSNHYYAESIAMDSHVDQVSSVMRLIFPPPSYRNEVNFCRSCSSERPKILGSCRGLVVLCYANVMSHLVTDLILWNPSTGFHRRIPEFEYVLASRDLYGFAYDASSDNYLLVLVGTSNTCRSANFSLKTASLEITKISLPCNYGYLSSKCKTGTLLNGALHWLVLSKDKKVPVIIAFDLVQRSFSEIPVYSHFDFVALEYHGLCLRVMGGCLSVCRWFFYFNNRTEIWMMKEYKMSSSWTKSFVISYPSRLSPICITKDGGVLASVDDRLVKHYHERKVPERVLYDAGRLMHCVDIGIDAQSFTYRESLLSLPI